MTQVPTYMGLGAANDTAKKLSVASTLCVVSAADAGKDLLWVGQSSAVRIKLPTPELGLRFRIILASQAVSSGTKIGSSSYDVIYANSTGKYVAFNSTTEYGQSVEMIGISASRYLAIPGSVGINNATSNSTAAWAVGTS